MRRAPRMRHRQIAVQAGDCTAMGASSNASTHAELSRSSALHRGMRVASHVRSYEPARATTIIEHMPKAHQKHVGWTPSRLIEEAQQTGPYTGQLVEAILAARRHPEMGYRSCLGIVRLAKAYPAERMEAAAQRALRARAYNFRSMDSILKNQLDRLPLPGPPLAPPAVEHDNIRAPITLISRLRASLRQTRNDKRRPSCSTNKQWTSCTRCACAAWPMHSSNNRRIRKAASSALKSDSRCWWIDSGTGVRTGRWRGG